MNPNQFLTEEQLLQMIRKQHEEKMKKIAKNF